MIRALPLEKSHGSANVAPSTDPMDPAELANLVTAARQAVPFVGTAADDFASFLAERATDEGQPPPLERAADLAIAFAACRSDPAALEALDALLVAAVARAVARIDASRPFAELVAQELRTHLLVGDRPRLAEYGGRGPLSAWLRTAAARVALNLRRGAANRAHDEISSKIRDAVTEPEMALVRDRYRDVFEASLRAALTALPSRERAVLSLAVRDGLTSEKIAVLYKVSRATAKRMLVRARALLLEETKRELRGRIKLTSSEFQSVARAVCDDLDVSVVRLLQSGER